MSWRTITGEHLVYALLAGGWQVIGERSGVYKRLAIVDGDKQRHVFMVPLDPSMADYEDLMNAVAYSLEHLLFDGRSAHQALYRIDPEVYG